MLDRRSDGGDGLGVVRGEKLNQLYADSKIVIGDSLSLNFDYPGYWSDRIYETSLTLSQIIIVKSHFYFSYLFFKFKYFICMCDSNAFFELPAGRYIVV